MPYKNLSITPNRAVVDKAMQSSQFYKGFSTTDDTKLTTKIYDFEVVKQDIINTFQTKQGERVMNPGFGTIIWGLIYEPFTEEVKTAIADDVTRILKADPRAIPTEIDIKEEEYGMLIEATLFFVNENLSEQLRLSFDRSTGKVV